MNVPKQQVKFNDQTSKSNLSADNRSVKKTSVEKRSVENKQNQMVFWDIQKDMDKIIPNLYVLFQQNQIALDRLERQFSQIKDNLKVEPHQQNCDIQTSKSINQTAMTLNECKCPKSKETKIMLSELNERFSLLEQQMNKRQIQQQFNLEKRLAQKGQKSQISKSINLTRLLVIEIQQVKDRFRQNQTKSKVHEQKIQNIHHIIEKMQADMLEQKSSFNKKFNQYSSAQNQNQQTFFNKIETIKINMVENFQTQLRRTEDCLSQKVNCVHKMIQEEKSQNNLKDVIHRMEERIVTLQAVQRDFSIRKQALQKEFNIQKDGFTKEFIKINVKNKKQSEALISKKIESMQKIFAKKNDFLSNSSEVQTHLNRLSQNIARINSALLQNYEQIQKKQLSQRILHENNIQSIMNKISQNGEEIFKKLSLSIEQISKTFKKYAKTEEIKKYFQVQNQKVHKVIDSNFQQQKLLNETLCSQNIVARWLWQGQQLKGGNLISWDKQVVNTLPDNFKFSSEKSNIIQVCNAGIYKFELGFYAKKKPTVQILINGKVIISAVNSNSYVLHHSSGKLKSIEPTQISGLSLIDFFLLPQNSRIAIAYSGDHKGQGFLNIQRL